MAAEGSDDAVDAIISVLHMQETLETVDAAVKAWLTMTPKRPNDDIEKAEKEQLRIAERIPTDDEENKTKYQCNNNPGDSIPREPTPRERQRYVDSLKPFALQTIDLVGKGGYYFRNALQGHGQGDAAARLRQMTKEISTLPSQLPIDWDSSILVAVDENRLDALRAVIFPHKDTPYAHGAFVFDILLPPEYPYRPPQVQFLTTGGGRVRFK